MKLDFSSNYCSQPFGIKIELVSSTVTLFFCALDRPLSGK